MRNTGYDTSGGRASRWRLAALPSAALLSVGALAALALPAAGSTGATAPATRPAAATSGTGAYAGAANGDLVHLNAINVPGVTDVADVQVAPTDASVDSTKSPRSKANATNLSLDVLQQLNADLVVQASQTAPPDHTKADHAELLSVPADPLLNAKVTTADALARWTGDTSCITTGPIAHGTSTVADATVLPAQLPGGADLLTLDNGTDPNGAVTTDTTVGLVKGSGGNHAVQSTSSTQITSIKLLGQVTVDVVTAPKLTATASGTAGGAKVSLNDPVLEINGQTVVSGQDLKPINIPGGPVLELSMGDLTKSESADGTKASGEYHLLNVKVLDVTGQFTLATLTVGDLTASATAPAGGVTCEGPSTAPSPGPNPLDESRKDLSAASVNAGKTFNYSVTVPNRGDCTVTGVKVVDTVSGPTAYPLELVSSTPEPSSHDGNTYTFDLGDLAPNQVKQIVMTFKVPAGAPLGSKYANEAKISGTCAGEGVDKTVNVDGPTVDGPGTGPCALDRSTKFASNLKVYKGENFTYFINVFNTGAQACTGVTVKDTLVSGTQFVSCSDDCTHSGQDVTWSLGTLDPGASRQVSVTVKTTAEPGTHLPDAAVITSDNGGKGNPSTPGPVVADVSVPAPGVPATRVANEQDQTLAYTGSNAWLPALGGLVLLGALGLARRRRGWQA